LILAPCPPDNAYLRSPQIAQDMPLDEPESDIKRFHGWRLLGVILCVVIVIAVVSALVDWLVIGPLEGRI